MSITICAIPANRIEDIWTEVLPVLEKVLKYNLSDYTLDEVKQSLIDELGLLICVYDGNDLLACITCQEEPHPTQKILHMPIVAGKRMKDWLDLCHQTIPNLARERGYDMLITKGRKGWGKVLAKYGFKERYISFGLEL